MKGAVAKQGDPFRWVLLGVLSCITIINYVDRQALSILYTAIGRDIYLPQQTYTLLVTIFLIAYTAMYTIGGWFVDRFGTRNGLAIALTWWSIATMLTASAHTAMWIEIFRVMLAIGQPIVFSAGVKACAEFFPSRQRALATGIFSAGSGIGALAASPALAGIALHLGWRWAMIVPGITGTFLVPLWIWAYTRTVKLPSIGSDGVAKQPWRVLVRRRLTWALVLPRAFGDPLWYFCFFWIPIYLQQDRHLGLRDLAFLGWMPFLFADLGSVLGGSLSDGLIRRGRPPVSARLAVIICGAVVAPLGALIGVVPSLWGAILLMGLIAFVSQCWTITTSALASDMFPRSDLGIIAGMMGTAGGIGAAIFSQTIGIVIRSRGFASAFAFAAVLMPIAALLLVTMLRSGRTRQIDEPVAV
jgi:ACS family hexuronate transporter-like MFS transporter